MNKLIVIGAASLVGLLVAGGAGFFGYKLHSELSEFKKVGSLQSMKTFSQENFDLKKRNKELEKSIEKIEKGFNSYRDLELRNAELRSERRVDTSVASFMPISGPYVLAAISSKEQEEQCEDVQRLTKLEADLFGNTPPDVFMRQEQVCNTNLDRKLIPLFKYQMLRVRASMSGSLGHLRKDADKKFDRARTLLSKWEVPISSELDAYTRFK